MYADQCTKVCFRIVTNFVRTFAYADKYICTCLLIKVIGPGSANFVYVDE